MNKRMIEKLIPIAIKSINSALENGKFGKSTKIPKEFNGYVASFGASIIQSGLAPTLAFYESVNSNSEEDRSLVNKLIFDVLKKSEYLNVSGEEKSLLKYVVDNYDKEDILKEKIIDTLIALKLSIRTFEFTDV